MKILYRKGIKSVHSSANTEGGVWFMIDKASLNEKNLTIAGIIGFVEEILHGAKDIKVLYLEKKLEDIDFAFSDVENWSVDIVNQFENQRFQILEK